MGTLHLQMTVEYARGWIKRDIREGRYPRILVNPDGSAAPVEEQLSGPNSWNACARRLPMTDKWTPRRGADGRWRVLAGITDPQEPGFGGPDTIIIAECFDAEHAALIAAAPELVEALRGLVAPYTIIRQGSTGSVHTGAPPRAALDTARALLDRIEKEANGD